MKSLSISVAIITMSLAVQAQFEESDTVNQVSEAINGPGPCNGFPEYRDLPINHAFYIGTREDGSYMADQDATPNASAPCKDIRQQTKSITQMLGDGLRYLDFNLCKHQGQIVTCSRNNGVPSSLSFSNILEQVFQFARDTVEQIVILNIDSENVLQSVDTKSLEAIIDEKCKTHTELTEGTDEFLNRECPFIYTHVPGRRSWPTMGELVNYDPDMAQWEGDGEIVGVRTKLIITKSEKVLPSGNYQPAYFTPKFWAQVPAATLQKEEAAAAAFVQVKDGMKQVCKAYGSAVGIGLNTYRLFDTCDENERDPQQQQELIEDLIARKTGCNLNSSPSKTYFSFVSVTRYDKFLPYLKELQRRMMKLNYAKWNRESATLEPSKLASKKQQAQHDEL